MSFVGEEQLWFVAMLLTVPRILGAFLAMPFLGVTILPGLARNALVIMVSAFTVPATLGYIDQIPLEMGTIAVLMVKEMALGFIFGYMVSIPFWAVSSAGFIIDLQRGVLSAQMFSNVLADQSSPLGDLFVKLSVVLLFTTGGFLILLEVLISSYQVWPVHSFMPNFSMNAVDVVLKQFALLFYMAAVIAGPIIATMFIVELGSAIVSRYVPQLNIFLLLMPIKSGIAIFLLVFYIQFIAQYMLDIFLKFGDILGLLDGVLK